MDFGPFFAENQHFLGDKNFPSHHLIGYSVHRVSKYHYFSLFVINS